MSDDERRSDATLAGGWTSSVELLAGIDLPGLRGDVHQRLFGGRPAGDATVPGRGGRLPRGAVVDRYVILELLGAGGMGVVYAAYDPQLDRRVALKLLRAKARGDVGRARMIREAHALAKLSHPNVVTVFDAGIHDDEVFLAMELVEGETLRAWLQQRDRSWQESLPVLILAGRGLASAHAAGVLHRDFKPENVMIDAAMSAGAERVRVMDFGLARRSGAESGESTPLEAELAASEPDANITRTGALLGTPAYMAPESFAGASGDARSDQFAFCVTAWEALFGERPHARASVRAQVDAVRGGAAPRAPAGTRVPGWLQRTLTRGLAVDPAERWPSLEALLAQLERGRTRMRRRRGLTAAL
ncbi:MAG: serine/threonine protein kinase, partial [Deltaproteobacteria bacterium]|nr:serine/threonine protein kinase [Nannocystaceae bacterium]